MRLITRDPYNALRCNLGNEFSVTHTKTNNRSLQIAALLTIAVLTIGTMQFAAAKDDSRIKIEGEFSGVDDGKAKFQSRDNGDKKKFSVEITPVIAGEYTIEVELADGTIFSNTVNVTVIEPSTTTTLDFNLDTQCEDDGSDCSVIPDMASGDIVTVTGPNLLAVATLS